MVVHAIALDDLKDRWTGPVAQGLKWLRTMVPSMRPELAGSINLEAKSAATYLAKLYLELVYPLRLDEEHLEIKAVLLGRILDGTLPEPHAYLAAPSIMTPRISERAILGPMHDPAMTNSFANGLLFNLYRVEGRIDVCPVFAHQCSSLLCASCSHCRRELRLVTHGPDAGPDEGPWAGLGAPCPGCGKLLQGQSDWRLHSYTGARCDRCNEPFSSSRDRVVLRTWIVATNDYRLLVACGRDTSGEPDLNAMMVHCEPSSGGCDNYFTGRSARCPRCDRPSSHRRTFGLPLQTGLFPCKATPDAGDPEWVSGLRCTNALWTFVPQIRDCLIRLVNKGFLHAFHIARAHGLGGPIDPATLSVGEIVQLAETLLITPRLLDSGDSEKLGRARSLMPQRVLDSLDVTPGWYADQARRVLKQLATSPPAQEETRTEKQLAQNLMLDLAEGKVAGMSFRLLLAQTVASLAAQARRSLQPHNLLAQWMDQGGLAAAYLTVVARRGVDVASALRAGPVTWAMLTEAEQKEIGRRVDDPSLAWGKDWKRSAAFLSLGQVVAAALPDLAGWGFPEALNTLYGPCRTAASGCRQAVILTIYRHGIAALARTCSWEATLLLYVAGAGYQACRTTDVLEFLKRGPDELLALSDAKLKRVLRAFGEHRDRRDSRVADDIARAFEGQRETILSLGFRRTREPILDPVAPHRIVCTLFDDLIATLP